MSLYVNVIIVHWRDCESLRRCLLALMNSDHESVRIIIVENASSNTERRIVSELASYARLQGAEVHLLQQTSNLGYAGGNNAGVRYLKDAQLDGVLCILNPDVVLERTTLKSMMACMREDVGIVMCRAVSPNGQVLYDAIRLRGYRQKKLISQSVRTETDYAQGACMLVNPELVRCGDLFDERFFLYWEEVDLSIRARQAGFKVISTTSAQIVRKQNSLSRLPNALYYSIRNAWLLLKKYPRLFSLGGYCLYAASLVPLVSKFYLRPALGLRAWRSLFAGVVDGVAGRYGQRSS